MTRGIGLWQRFGSLAAGFALLVAAFCGGEEGAYGDVLVLTNRTDSSIALTVGASSFDWVTTVLKPGETQALYVPPSLTRVTVHSGSEESSDATYACDPGRPYFVYRGDAGRVSIAAIGLASGLDPAGQLEELIRPHVSLPRSSACEPVLRINAVLAVDDEQPMKAEVWRQRLAKRLEDASRRLQRQLGVSVRCVGFATWDSDDSLVEFQAAMNEFADEVDPGAADVVIGFTSQFGTITAPGGDLGNARGPLTRHILIREGTGQLLYVDRVELLVHELGHFLGAAHSPEPDSAMRPVLGDHRAVRKDALIQLDPLNCLASAVLIDAASGRGELPESVVELDFYSRYLLSRVYRTLDDALPEDPVAGRYLALVRPAEFIGSNDLADAVRRVVEAVVAEAAQVKLEPLALDGVGDGLTERYFRAAASAAAELPEALRGRAFLLGLAIALDRYDFFARNTWLAPIYRAVEGPEEREQRLRLIGEPTMYRRGDLLAHFTVSAALTSLVGKTLALQAGILKEQQDAQGGSGFSFADLAADLAGIEFALHTANDPEFLERVARNFRVSSFVPDPQGLPEGLSAAEFASRYGNRNDPRFLAALQAIQDLVESLPGYSGGEEDAELSRLLSRPRPR